MICANSICLSMNCKVGRVTPPAVRCFRQWTLLLVAALLVPAALAADPVLKTESRKPKAESRKPKVESRKSEVGSRKSETEVKPEVAPVPANVVLEIPQSVFLVSSTTQTIKDPFFPNSTRLTAAVTKTTLTNAAAVVAADLALKAISGTPARPLATINNTTFGVGEEREIRTPNGRIRVRCVEIRLQDEAVVIEVGGQRRELRFSRRK